MSGIKFLLDTNFILGIIRGNPETLDILSNKKAKPTEYSYSFITRIELLSYPSITQPEIEAIQGALSTMLYCSMSDPIENVTIHLRRQYKIKIPDAIIAATAIALNLELLTLDQQLAKQLQDILSQEKKP